MPLTPEQKRKLATMGVSWYISRLYFDKIDSEQRKWEYAGTQGPRECEYDYIHNHIPYLEEIMGKNPNRLGTNRIGLHGDAIIRMAKELLQHFESNENIDDFQDIREAQNDGGINNMANVAIQNNDIVAIINDALEQGCSKDFSISAPATHGAIEDQIFIYRQGVMKFRPDMWENFRRYNRLIDRKQRMDLIRRTCRELNLIDE